MMTIRATLTLVAVVLLGCSKPPESRDTVGVDDYSDQFALAAITGVGAPYPEVTSLYVFEKSRSKGLSSIVFPDEALESKAIYRTDNQWEISEFIYLCHSTEETSDPTGTGRTFHLVFKCGLR